MTEQRSSLRRVPVRRDRSELEVGACCRPCPEGGKFPVPAPKVLGESKVMP